MVTAMRRSILAVPAVLVLLALLFPERALAFAASALLSAVLLAQLGVWRRVRTATSVPGPSMDDRRALLRKGLLGAAGAAGLSAGLPQAVAAAAPGAPSLRSLRRFTAVGGSLRISEAQGHAELFDKSGTRIGDYHSTTTALGGGTGLGIHQHVFVFGNGVLFGMGAGALADEESTFSIVGGTGEYAGATGVCKAARRARDFGGDGAATFKFRLKR